MLLLGWAVHRANTSLSTRIIGADITAIWAVQGERALAFRNDGLRDGRMRKRVNSSAFPTESHQQRWN